MRAYHILYAGTLVCLFTSGACYGSPEHQAFFIVLGFVCFGFGLLAHCLKW